MPLYTRVPWLDILVTAGEPLIGDAGRAISVQWLLVIKDQF